MQRFQAILGLLAVSILGAQTLRHAYVMFVEPTESVLDQYEPAKEEIDAAKSLDELLSLYESTRQKTDEAKKQNPKEPHEDTFDYEYRLRADDESFQRLSAIEDAIRERESHSEQLCELHFFAIAGIVVSLAGAFLYRRIQKWAGISICTLGTLELIWATSPSFSTFGYPPEFDQLLMFKLIYSFISLTLLAAGWLLATRFATNSPSAQETAGNK